MADDFQREIRSHLEDFLEGRGTVDSVAAWLSGELAQHPAMTPETDQLAYATRLLFAEHARGDRSDEQLRSAVRELVKTTFESYSPTGTPAQTSIHATTSSTSVVTRSFASGVRIQPAAGRA